MQNNYLYSNIIIIIIVVIDYHYHHCLFLFFFFFFFFFVLLILLQGWIKEFRKKGCFLFFFCFFFVFFFGGEGVAQNSFWVQSSKWRSHEHMSAKQTNSLEGFRCMAPLPTPSHPKKKKKINQEKWCNSVRFGKLFAVILKVLKGVICVLFMNKKKA